MAELSTLARPYAEAVFRLAEEQGTLDKWSETLQFIATIVQDPQIVSVIANPKVDRTALKTLLLDIGDEYLDEVGKNLIKLLIDNGKLMIVPQLVSQYEQLKAQHQGYVKVEIVSAYEVEPPQREAIETALQKRLGKAVELNITLDSTLIGGWLIRTENQVIDISIKGRLQQMAAELRY
jgi:F-type H+-transporting ATPase subunit delta